MYEADNTMSITGLELSVVLPAFNESRRLPRALPTLIEALDGDTTELIVVDDGSDDDTAQVAAEHLASFPRGRVVRLPVNAGKGAATRIGVSRARGQAVVFMDADLATDPASLAPLVEALDTCDVAIGSRSHPDSVIEGASRSRSVMGRGFNLVCRVGGAVDHRDTQCGFKGFRGPAAKVLFHLSRLNGFAFDVELLMLAGKLGLRVAEVPVHWTAVPGSTVDPLRDPLPMALDVVRSRVRWRGARPLAAVTALAGGEGQLAASALREHVRQVDPVVWWEGGAVALFPCTDRNRVARIGRRLRRRIPECEIGLAEFPVATLVPASGGLLRSALAA